MATQTPSHGRPAETVRRRRRPHEPRPAPPPPEGPFLSSSEGRPLSHPRLVPRDPTKARGGGCRLRHPVPDPESLTPHQATSEVGTASPGLRGHAARWGSRSDGHLNATSMERQEKERASRRRGHPRPRRRPLLAGSLLLAHARGEHAGPRGKPRLLSPRRTRPGAGRQCQGTHGCPSPGSEVRAAGGASTDSHVLP